MSLLGHGSRMVVEEMAYDGMLNALRPPKPCKR
jgi:hypothetical protein